ncbi:MAG: DUF6338 family protein [Thermoguttaceae bacterium]
MIEAVFEKMSIGHLVLLFVVISLPGLVSMHAYRLVLPHRDMDWKTAFQESIFWGSLNFAFAFPLCYVLTYFLGKPEWLIFGVGPPVFLIGLPAFWPWLFSKMLRWNIVKEKFVTNLPCPTAWDYYFGVIRKECFVLVHLKNGEKIGGFYGSTSYATSFPRNGDMYLEKTVKVDEGGYFQGYVEDTLGVLITKDEYKYIELFERPPQQAS